MCSNTVQIKYSEIEDRPIQLASLNKEIFHRNRKTILNFVWKPQKV